MTWPASQASWACASGPPSARSSRRCLARRSPRLLRRVFRSPLHGARREYPFAFSLGAGEPLLTGVLDILLREPDGGLLVVDYKSDRVAAEEDLEEVVEREYSIQRLHLCPRRAL